jgi:pyridoxal phosphate enzyme (YggS family)
MTDSELEERLAANLAAVEARIAAACARAGRPRTDVTLVAVTKYASARVAARLHDLGVADLGESRPQVLWRKADALPRSVRWHLIGHLQRNKVDKTLPRAALIHSVDSVRLIEALAAEADRQSRDVPLLIEVNLSGEASKTGLDPAGLPEARAAVARHPRLHLRGLMTMAAHDGPEAARPVFRRLRELGGPLLSMGMTNDFEVAIEEGATHVRVGSALFEGIPPEALRAG